MTQLHAGGKFDNTDDAAMPTRSRAVARRGRVGRQRAVGLAGTAVWRNDKNTCAVRAWRLREHVREGGRCPPRASAAPRCASWPRPRPTGRRHVLQPRLQLQDAGKPAARTGLPEFRRAHHLEDERPAEPLRTELFYEGGVRNSCKYLDRNKTRVMPEPIYMTGEKRRHRHRGRDVVERQLPRERAALHQQHPAARRRHASGGLPRRADPHDQQPMPSPRASPRRKRSTSPATTRAKG
jgi:hypothetical protein